MNELMPVAILCGGRGTRLGSLTQHTPKSLISVADHPFLWHQLELLKRNGVKRVVLLVGHLGKQIQDMFQDGSKFGIQIEYSYDWPQPLGTAGAIRKALPLLPDQFFVMYGDSYLDCDYRAVQDAYWKNIKPAQMTSYGGVDYGLGIFHKDVFVSYSVSDLAELYQELSDNHMLSVFPMKDRFYEIGSREGLRETEVYLKTRYVASFLKGIATIAEQLDVGIIDKMASALIGVKGRSARLFVLGVGGSAANASHAAADFRKLAGIEAYAPTDNVSELTARTNDDGWNKVFVDSLRTSKLRSRDVVLVFSVGGGSREKKVSENIVEALEYAKAVGCTVLGIVGRDGGETAKLADVCVVIPTLNPKLVTFYAESFQAILWHLLASYPSLQSRSALWESLT